MAAGHHHLSPLSAPSFREADAIGETAADRIRLGPRGTSRTRAASPGPPSGHGARFGAVIDE